MNKDITLGQYYPIDSVIHRLDPRTKLTCTFLYIIFLFVANNIWGYCVAFLFLATVVALSRVPVKFVLKGLKAVIYIVLITMVINLLWTQGTVIWEWKFIHITIEGIRLSINMTFRLILLITGTTMMTLTTSSIALTDGLEVIFKKIPFIGRYSHELSMMMSIALRFIPTLMDETDKIMKAQKSRGADFETGGIIKKAKALIPILVPLFVSAFQRANELAMAMESRCYNGGEGRTRLKQLQYAKRDTVAYVISFIVFVAMVATRWLPVLI